MDTSCLLQPVQYCFFSEKAFYFEEAGLDSELDHDAFRKSVHSDCTLLLKSKDDKVLYVSAQAFEAEHLSCGQKPDSEHKFNVRFYVKTLGTGKAVMLYVKHGDKVMVVSCNERREVLPEAMEPPSEIKDDGHRAVFFRTKVSESKYKLESSIYPSEFLGFQEDENEPTLSKLVLCHLAKDEVDESCEVIFSNI